MIEEAKKHHPLLLVKDLTLDIQTENGSFNVVNAVNFEVNSGEVLGIVGESGSGKTLTCMSFTQLLPSPPIIYKSGEIHFNNKNLWELDTARLQPVRGKDIRIIFQEAMSTLNPVKTVGSQVAEIFTTHFDKSKTEAKELVIDLFKKVEITLPAERFDQYPHQLSGGLQQRVLIASALAGNPKLLIADEPTTALDVTIQAQIMQLLFELKKSSNMSIIFINHDLGLIAELCDRVLVMYAGEIVESAPVALLFKNARHPYTKLLLAAIPSLDKPRGEMTEIPGQVPAPADFATGCRFATRCPFADQKCRSESPPRIQPNHFHEYKCWHPIQDSE